jgi:hypothetical protein
MFIYGLFIDAVSSSGCVVLNELEMMWKEAVMGC